MKNPPGQNHTRGLLVVATPIEAEALGAHHGIVAWHRTRLNDRADIVIAGIGKANAAGASAHAATPDTPFILSIGVAGALPDSRLDLGDIVLATQCVYADEGLETPTGYQTCSEMGFPIGIDESDIALPDQTLVDALSPIAAHLGVIATVSTCSGTDEAATRVVERTGAVAEAMEGAAVVHTARRLGLPAAELRVISNTTGDRDRQRWDLPGALARLADVIGSI